MSAGSFQLVPLDCPSCGSAVAADGGDVVYYCISCRNGYQYREEDPHLEPVEVTFVAASNISAERYSPFWILPAHVELHDRNAGRSAMPNLLQVFLGNRPGEGFRGEGEFVVPAFEAPLDSTVELTRRYTETYPRLDEKLGERLTGGCFGVADAKKLAHFSLIATEVDKPDTLRTLKYSIRFGSPRLLGVPFARRQSGREVRWVDAVHNIPV